MILKLVLKKNVFVGLTIFLSGFFVLIISNSLYKSTIYETVSNNLYNNDTCHFVQSGSVELNDLIKISNNTFVSKELSEYMRGIYFSSIYNYKLPVIEGRFFNYKDFQINNNYVVVGKDLKDQIYKKENKSYYKYNNKEYEVIGILGIDVESILDKFVFFNLINIYEYAPQKTNISFGEDTTKLINNIEELKLSECFNKISLPNTGISRIWGFSNIYILVLACVYICFIVTTLFLILLKSNYYKKYLIVFKTLGFNNKYIYKNVLLNELFIYAFSLFWGEIMGFLFLFKKYFQDTTLLTIMLNISLVSCFIYILFTYILFKSHYKNLLK